MPVAVHVRDDLPVRVRVPDVMSPPAHPPRGVMLVGRMMRMLVGQPRFVPPDDPMMMRVRMLGVLLDPMLVPRDPMPSFTGTVVPMFMVRVGVMRVLVDVGLVMLVVMPFRGFPTPMRFARFPRGMVELVSMLMTAQRHQL